VDEATFVATTAGVERAGRSVVANHERVTRDGYTIATWLYGSTRDGEALARQCRERGDVLLEDASQAHGNKLAGTFGDAAAWSLYPSKNLGGIGQGGVVTFKDSLAAAKARRIREHGYDRATDRHFGRGFNMRMDAINADVLRVKLRHLDKWTARRREIARAYIDELGSPTVCPYLMRRTSEPLDGLPKWDDNHAWHLFVVRVANRDTVLAKLRAQGVMAQVHYRTDAFGRENDWNRECLSLPCHAQMSDSDVERVIEAVKASVA
jgi:dTDP-4-amino-4,6-dideoxygalactose transaminase